MSRGWPFLLLVAGVWSSASADVVELTPDRDNTVFSFDEDKSNGQGIYLFSGKTSSEDFGVRRALLRFDLSGIPPGSVVNSASLTLKCSRHPFSNPTPQTHTLHRVLADWGEGTSDAGASGQGALATAGDATWTQRFYGAANWATPGGDLVAAPSGATVVGTCTDMGDLTDVTFASSPQLVADVQVWASSPGTNFGWALVGNEAAFTTARRFQSRDDPVGPYRPRLTIDFDPAVAGPAGDVPDGTWGNPMRLLRLDGGELFLNWDASCQPTDDDYAVYRGTLGSFYSHTLLLCSTSQATQSIFTPLPGDAYFLVVPVSTVDFEGAYGKDSFGNPRPPGTSACFSQDVANPACP